MRKFLLTFACIAAMGLVACKGGDEAPPEQSPYISLLGLNPLAGTIWVGSANIQTCADDPIASSCATLYESETLAQENGGSALTFIVGLNQNTLNGNLTFVTPQYGYAPIFYTMGVVGTTEEGATSDRVVRLTQVSVLPAGTPSVGLTEFTADQQLEKLTGRMRLLHIAIGSAARANVLYTFTMNKSR